MGLSSYFLVEGDTAIAKNGNVLVTGKKNALTRMDGARTNNTNGDVGIAYSQCGYPQTRRGWRLAVAEGTPTCSPQARTFDKPASATDSLSTHHPVGRRLFEFFASNAATVIPS